MIQPSLLSLGRLLLQVLGAREEEISDAQALAAGLILLVALLLLTTLLANLAG
jgi:hypothetical protein